MRETEQRSIEGALVAKFPLFARSTIHRWVMQEAEQYETAKVQVYVPVLVEKTLESRLTHLSQIPAAPIAYPV
jgi:hypothetical protein